MLAGHSEVHCPPETWLLLPLYAYRSDEPLVATHQDLELAKSAIGDLIDDRQLVDAARGFLVTLYNQLLQENAKRILVDKTPRYYRILDFIEQLFPAATKVWLKRNPLDIAASFKSAWGIPPEELMGVTLNSYSFDATISFTLLLDFFKQEREGCAVVHYEDLVARPREVLERLLTMIGVVFEPEMIRYAENRGLMDQYRRASMGDKNLLEHSEPHNQSIGRWRTELTSDELRLVLQTLGSQVFRDLGYRDAYAEACDLAGLSSDQLSEEGNLPALKDQYRQVVDRGIFRPGGTLSDQVARQNAALIRDFELMRVAVKEQADREKRLREQVEQLSHGIGLFRQNVLYRVLARLNLIPDLPAPDQAHGRE
jgi:hypothetical protein